ncbi:toxin-antitoxin system HicB family antitoxin [Paenibacillus radicis (ex Xue et al. 2023)]|uniref:Toxin-antitoxin system HicB family antitoxin n=1 Tax=Paenibacillus radicis (ex Xue et al. 2023) TaxID=2972489 RepID=A0ABT1Y9I0_9BACL|nr:toxin-antitoxin system HicB family antitoxin [Paenibacillus radicis (ex Xue et al. 2023)]MCR8629827.1 toxin-antitoxin system HicB family antitoxin [Paenibacillus radicis (ex Xue et al. 2023)]
MTQVMEKNLEYYLNLNYTLLVNHIVDESGSYYYGKIVELDGCHSTADTVEELIKDLEEVKKAHIEIKLEFGDLIPEPKEMPSGNIMLRMPKTLHWKLANEAEREGISLNQYILYKLSSK